MVRGLRRGTMTFPHGEVQAVGIRGNNIALVTSGGVENIVVPSQAAAIGSYLATLLVPGHETTSFTPETAGLISKKVKERGQPWTLHQPAGVDLAASLV